VKREHPDFHAVRPEHRSIHADLLNWCRVVRDSQDHSPPQPMFRHYRSTEVWVASDPQIPTDTQAGWRMEKHVRNLPEKHREAIRWHYIRRKLPPIRQARKLAVSMLVLCQLVHDGRSMLKNRA
jgi:hypothetical protein